MHFAYDKVNAANRLLNFKSSNLTLNIPIKPSFKLGFFYVCRI